MKIEKELYTTLKKERQKRRSHEKYQKERKIKKVINEQKTFRYFEN